MLSAQQKSRASDIPNNQKGGKIPAEDQSWGGGKDDWASTSQKGRVPAQCRYLIKIFLRFVNGGGEGEDTTGPRKGVVLK